MAELDLRKPIYPSAELIKNNQELWRPIPGWDGYQVSTHGRIMSFWELVGRPPQDGGGSVSRIGATGRLRALQPDDDGRQYVTIRNGRRRKNATVCSLVLIAFVGPRPKGMEACHADDDPSNNRLSNLRWDTRRGNLLDRYRESGRVLTPVQVIEIKSKIAAGITPKDIAAEYGVTTTLVRRIKRGLCWSHVG